ncbi:NAD(P)-dependent alcohol dehydrogenase [Roseateles oligotrophus]|uniref:NAD(P)-dependent alcohol dehydrogenase n=1 Tax=Roseateles oligotrophus TaxID=1769250 RepID=A0ABT2YC28_9BURK|nr:NAD(P)-dependent alcohol dehydrogenase [Roseateles oligotrophus]MCV2367585.1 NAD(P)-dependent alcohol dehydrogenase [Roseateles oligotrophus]
MNKTTTKPMLTMQAWVCQRYGGPEVLALQTRPLPQPGDHEVLIRIHASTVASGDVRVRTLKLPRGFGLIGRLALGFTGPRQPVLGTDLAGVVEAVGREVTSFKPGDAVMGFAGAAMGCHAEYRCLDPRKKPLVLKPAKLGFEQAASLLFGGMTALHYLRKAELKAGEKILVIGASGAVGTAFVQLARHLGAEVTGVCSGANVDLVRSLGAARVIDYRNEDFTQSAGRFDVIADTVGASNFAACCPVLNEGGRYLSVAGGLPDLLARPRGSKRSIGGPAAELPADIQQLARLAEQGVLQPVIDRSFAFEEAAAAHAYVETGRKRGAVLLNFDSLTRA